MRDVRSIELTKGRKLVELRGAMHAAGADPADLRAAGDRSSHEFIAEALARTAGKSSLGSANTVRRIASCRTMLRRAYRASEMSAREAPDRANADR